MNDLITNGTEIKQRIISEITNAEHSIYVAMAYFTDRDIAVAIIEAKKRELTVDVILSSNSQNDTVKLMLRGASVSVHAFETGDTRGIMHHKFCLIDDKISINGSYNYSINASNNNVENIQVSDDSSTYSQFLNEFNRLKHNIDNSIAVNEFRADWNVQKEKVVPKNIVNTFSEQLQNLVYSAAQIDTEMYRRRGFKTSEESSGSIDIFSTEYKTIEGELRTYATDEGLGSIKNILESNISNAYGNIKASLETEKLEKINHEKRKNDLEKNQIIVTNDKLKEVKSLLESGHQITGEKGLFQINKEIEKNRLERRNLEHSFIIRKFWNPETAIIFLGFLIFSFYLSLFFASAMYKVFFEENAIRTALEAGLSPGIPQIVDANAVIKIFNQQGPLFGFIASIFFLIPVLLSNLKILGSEKKVLNMLLFWVGIIIFDVIVAITVTMNIDEIKSLIVGEESTLQIWHVFKCGEFWMTFVFGMLPLIIMHFIIEKLSKIYKNSRRDIVCAEKNSKIQNLDAEMIDFQAEKKMLTDKLEANNDLLEANDRKTLDLETVLNGLETQIENYYNELLKQIKDIYDDFSARIMSGRIFTDVILDDVITSFKSGFIEHLPQYYASDEVSRRVRRIEEISTTTNK